VTGGQFCRKLSQAIIGCAGIFLILLCGQSSAQGLGALSQLLGGSTNHSGMASHSGGAISVQRETAPYLGKFEGKQHQGSGSHLTRNSPATPRMTQRCRALMHSSVTRRKPRTGAPSDQLEGFLRTREICNFRGSCGNMQSVRLHQLKTLFCRSDGAFVRYCSLESKPEGCRFSPSLRIVGTNS
jgi:hypothetical protein